MKQQLSVLLADDDRMVSASIAAWLEDEGFQVHTAFSGGEAMRLLTMHRIDVALVDLNLGDMSGEELISHAIAIHPDTRFMICTGKNSYQLPPELLAQGMRQDDIIFKPVIKLDDITAIIRRKGAGAPGNA